MKKLILLLCIVPIFSKATNIAFSGTISSNTTWTVDTVEITGNITIDDGIKLTINPGTHVQFNGPYNFFVNGSINATGSVSDSIYFTQNDTTGFWTYGSMTGGWGNINISSDPSTNDSCLFEYCKISYSKNLCINPTWCQKLRIEHSLFYFNRTAITPYCIGTPLIRNNSFLRNDQGIFIYYNSSPRIENNFFKFNIFAIVSDHSSPKIINNTITESTNLAIMLGDAGPSSEITGNDISFSHAGAIEIWAHSSTSITNNTIHDNFHSSAGGGIVIASSSPLISNNIIFNNVASGGSGIIMFNNSAPLILKNKICNNKATGLGCAVQDDGAAILVISSSPKIINNLIANNESEDFGAGIAVLDSSSALIVNNTIVNNRSNQRAAGGISVSTPFYNSTIKNNIIYGNSATMTGNDVYFVAVSALHQVLYNTISDTSNFYGAYSANYSNLSLANPQFVSPSGGSGNAFDGLAANWNLQIASPSINAGDLDTNGLFLPSTDLGTSNRIHSGRIDQGVYENVNFVSTGIEEQNKEEAFLLYPNPAVDYINIVSIGNQDKIKTISIYDAFGKIVLYKKETNNFGSQSIEIASLAKGVYSISIETPLLIHSYTIIKK